ncbi:MAG: hypothetical protein CBD74_13015 [Saprospirales bacterium TMED214]|nr:MAG: hypothetical protein CBD74_13015 [Saprospirales bacterium TMED214]
MSEKHSSYYYDFNRNRSGINTVNCDGYSISISDENDWNDFWSSAENDGIVGSAGIDTIPTDNRIDFNMKNDKIELNLESTEKNGFWKYEEDLTMKEIRDYLSSTYQAHYTSKDSKTQTLDLIEGIGDAEPFCRSNAIKYLSRFGKKNGKSKQDILKAIHYCILLYHFSGLHKQPKGNYETF